MNFSRKDVQNFSTLHHLPSECNISTTVALNQTKLKPLETRQLELSMHINSKKPKLGNVSKQPYDFQTRNKEKVEKCWQGDDVVDKDGVGIGVPSVTLQTQKGLKHEKNI